MGVFLGNPSKIFDLAVKVQIRRHFIKILRGCKEF